MPTNEANKNTKHISTFWAMFMVFVVTAVAGGVIYFYARNNQFQEDLYSISFSSPVHFRKDHQPKAKAPVQKTIPVK